jgi:integrase
VAPRLHTPHVGRSSNHESTDASRGDVSPVGVQQRLMRHADIRTTMNTYGDAATPDMREACGKIVGLALNETARKRV